MKRLWIASFCILFGCVSLANAAMIVSYVRTPYDANFDKIDFHIAGLTGMQLSFEITSLSGTWSSVEPDAMLSMSSSSSGWKNATMLNGEFAPPAAPQSFVNLNANTGDLTRTGGAGTLWQSWQGGYYTVEPAVFLGPADPDPTDGFDQTLLATIYLTKGKNVGFVGTAAGRVGEYPFDVTFSTPEPSTLVILASGAIGLLAFARRRCRRSH